MQWGKQYFFTATIVNWLPILLKDDYKAIVFNEWKTQIERENLNIYAFVIMPNHYHLICSFKSPKQPYETQRDMHKFISKTVIAKLKLESPEVLSKHKVNSSDRQYQVWQRNPLAIELYDLEITEQKLDYIHENPCQEHWELATYPEEYRYSSADLYTNNNPCMLKQITHYKD